MYMTRVRFVEEGGNILALLEVETSSRTPPLVLALTSAMFDMRVQIVRLRSKLTRTRRIQQLWIVEFDGASIRPARRLEIQDRVLQVVDSVPRPARRVTAAARAGAAADERPPAA
jgi:hypothetical protein